MGLFSGVKKASSAGFPGEVVVSDVEVGREYQGKPGRPQLHWGIRPLTFEAKGANGTGMMHQWYTISSRSNSVFGELEAQLEDMGFNSADETGEEYDDPIEAANAQAKQFLGEKFYFDRKDFDFGSNKKTGQKFQAKDVLFPTRRLSDEEADEIVKSHLANAKASGASAPVTETPTASVFDGDTLAAVATAIDGKTQSEAISAISAAGLGPSIMKSFATSSKIQKALTEGGYVTKDAEGRYHAASS